MKKFVVIIMVFAMTLSLAVPTFADGETTLENSFHVSEEIRQELGATETDTVLRLYNISFTGVFSVSAKLESMMDHEYTLVTYAVISADGTVVNYMEKDGGYEPVYIMIDQDMMDRFLSGELAKVIAPDVEVYDAYYLTNEASREGTGVYFHTNLGDYIYYSVWYIGECLFPVDVFHQYQAELFEALKAIYNNGDMVTGEENPEIWDLSSFKVDSPTFDPNAPIVRIGDKADETQDTNQLHEDKTWIVVLITCAVIAIAGGGLVIWKKRKTA